MSSPKKRYILFDGKGKKNFSKGSLFIDVGADCKGILFILPLLLFGWLKWLYYHPRKAADETQG